MQVLYTEWFIKTLNVNFKVSFFCVPVVSHITLYHTLYRLPTTGSLVLIIIDVSVQRNLSF